MATELQLDTFQGPLDLLLKLIEGQKLVITEVSLAQVTEQYLAYLRGLSDERSAELADFLVIATRLVYLKSRELLPELAPVAEEEQSLADQLKLYKRYREASQVIAGRWNQGEVAYPRIELPPPPPPGIFPANAAVIHLQGAWQILLERLKPINPLPEVAIDRTVSLAERVKNIFATLARWSSLPFSRIIKGAATKTDVIINFLAVLELFKQGQVDLDQPNAFDDIVIRRI